MVNATNRIAAIVVTYNRLPLLLECIDALKQQTAACFDILVIDNASTDGTEEKLRPFAEQGTIIYKNTGANLGGAGGFNYGIRQAYEMGYDYFWLMDDDTIPTPTALEKLLDVRHALQDDFGFLSSYAKYTDGSICLMNVPFKEEPESGVMIIGGSRVELIERATFVSFFVSRDVVRQIGLPIKEFFIWADDINNCIRINKQKQGFWVLDSVVTHKMASNQESNIVIDNGNRLERYVYDYRNRFFNARMEHKLGGYFVHVIKRVRRILISSKDRKLLRLKIMFTGMWQGFFFHPAIEYVDEES